jgi:hypothetical protein
MYDLHRVLVPRWWRTPDRLARLQRFVSQAAFGSEQAMHAFGGATGNAVAEAGIAKKKGAGTVVRRRAPKATRVSRGM